MRQAKRRVHKRLLAAAATAPLALGVSLLAAPAASADATSGACLDTTAYLANTSDVYVASLAPSDTTVLEGYSQSLQGQSCPAPQST